MTLTLNFKKSERPDNYEHPQYFPQHSKISLLGTVIKI